MASVSWSMSICNIVFTFAFIFAISMAGERGADWVLAWIKGTAWGRARTGNTMVVVRMREKFRARVRVRVTALINSSFYLTFGAAYYFHHLWESFFLPPLFTEPMTGWSIGYPEVMAGGFALLGLLCMLSHLWRIKSPRLFSLTWWSVPVVLLVVASLSLRHATSLQLLGQSGANIAPEDIGLYDFLNLLSQAGEGNEEDWTAAHLRSIAVLLLLLILPLINALMDWLSVGFSRAQFAKLTRDLSAGEHQQWPQLRSGLWDLAVDALGAVVFKATVLALLTFWALVINGRGVSFTLQTMTDYWQRIWPLGNLPFDGDVLLQGNELLISLMIATTLVPTLVHGTWVLTVIAFSGVAALTRSVFFAALWQPKLGAAVLSLLCVCALIWGVDLVNQRLDRAKATTTQTMPTASPNR